MMDSRSPQREPALHQDGLQDAAVTNPPGRDVRAARRRYMSARTVISLIALASLVVPGIVALLAAAVQSF